MRFHRNILLFLFLSNLVFPQIQEIKFEQISLNKGLSQSVVLDIIQDNEGFLWIATQDGLNKYDGYSFKIFKQIPADTNSLSDNWINTLLVDKNDLWIGTEYGGINKYNFKTGIIKRIKYDFGKPVRIIQKDKYGNFWIGTWGEGLIKFNPVTGKFKRYLNIPGDNFSLSHNRVRSLLIDEEDNIWVGTASGLNRLEKDSEKFTHYFNDPSDSKSISNNFIVTIIEDNRHRLWIGTPDGLNLFQKGSKKFERFKHDPSNPNSLSDSYLISGFQDKSAHLWFGTLNGGLCKMISDEEIPSQSKTKFIRYKNDQLNINSLSCNYVRKIFQDYNNVFWVGTWGGGLSKFDTKPLKFIHYKPEIYKKNCLSFPYVRSFFKDEKSNLYIGTDGNGIDYFDASENKFYNYKFTEDELLDFNYIYSFHKDSEGNIWIGTFAGLGKLPVKIHSGKTKISLAALKANFEKFRAEFSITYIRAIKSLNNEILLLGTSTGLVEYNISTNEFKKLDQKNLPPVSVTSIRKDKNNVYFIGTIQGMYKIKFELKKKFYIPAEVNYYKNIDNDPSTISSDKVNFIHIDSKERIWAGTSLGLNLFDQLTGKFTYFLSTSGLPNEIINGILEDKNNNLWISTNGGLSKMTEEKEKFLFRNYDESDGLQSNEFNQSSCYISEDGEMFFGGINGFNRFYPENVTDNQYKPKIVLTRVKIFNKEIEKDRLDKEHKQLTVSYSENFISFEFAALDFTNPSKNLYKYKMEGFDKNWIDAGTNNFATYTNLDPGNYTFRVIASNNDGIWNTRGDHIVFIITPPFWMTWWFRVIIVLFTAGIIALIFRIRVQRIIELERLRTRIASDLHDEVGASLTKISMQAGLANYDSSIQNIKPKLTKIEDTSREVISTMSDIVWSIDARNDTIGNLLDRMRDFAFNLLSDKQIEFQFNLEGFNNEKKIPVNLRQNIYLIYKETLNNIVKHSCASEINIGLINKNGQFMMRVVDNGKGLPDVLRVNGNGIKNMKMRTERIKGKIEFINSNGFTVVLTAKEL